MKLLTIKTMTAEITRIWTDFNKELKGYIKKVVKNQSDADDILQEVFTTKIRVVP